MRKLGDAMRLQVLVASSAASPHEVLDAARECRKCFFQGPVGIRVVRVRDRFASGLDFDARHRDSHVHAIVAGAMQPGRIRFNQNPAREDIVQE